MSDREKSREELLAEVAALRQSAAEARAELRAEADARRRAEGALRESGSDYRAIFDAASDAIFVHDIETGRILDANARACEMLGAGRGEVVGRPVGVRAVGAPPYSGEDALRWIQQAAREGPQLFEWQTQRQNGRPIWLEVNLKHATIAGAGRVLAMVRDISERKRAEEALRASETQYRTTIETLSDAVHVVDAALRVVLVNPALVALCEGAGVSTAIVGRTLAEAFPFLRERVFDEYREVFETGRALVTEERTVPSDKEFVTETRKIPVFEGDRVVRVVTVLRDITESKRVEEALRASRMQYRSTVDALDDSVHVVDRDLRIVLANARFANWCEKLGLGADLVGKTVPEAFPFLNEAILDNYGTVFATGQAIRTYETDYVNGRELIVEARKVPVFESGRVVRVVTVLRDVTERKRVEEALRESEERYRTLAESAPDLIFIIGRDDRVQYVNEAGCEAFGCRPEELVGKPRDGLFPAPASGEQQVKLRAVLESGQATYHEGATPFPAGERWLSTVLAPLRGPSGEVGAVLGVSRDITERRRAEEALRESQRTLATLMGNLPGMAYRCRNDPEWTMEFISEGCFELTGHPPDDLLGSQRVAFADLIHPDDREYVWSEVQAAVRERRPFRLTYRIRTATSQEKWVWEQGTGVGAADGPLLRLEGFITDITASKHAEAALRENEARYRTLFEDSPISLWEEDFSEAKAHIDALKASGIDDLRAYFDAHREAVGQCAAMVRVERVNRATLALYGVEDAAQLRESLSSVLAEESHDLLREELLAIAEGRTSFEGEGVNRTVTGEKKNVVVRWRVAPGHEATLSRVLVSIVDITEKLRLEKELANARRLESLGVLAGGIAHDFNNLLAGIVLNLSLARGQSRDAAVRQPLADAEQACLRAKSLTHQLLTFSMGGAPVRTAASIGELLTDTASFALAGSSVRAAYEIAEDVWPAEIDTGQISQVVQNIVLNAKQAMPHGGTLTVRACNAAIGAGDRFPGKPGRYVRIDIADEGIGIPPHHLHRIFDPYFTTKQEGSGLGLATAYSVIKRHEGHLSVDSVLGRGTTFRIYLPAAESGPAAAPAPTPRASIGGGRVLLMDDERMIRRAASALLDRLGYDVVTAHDGAEAIDLFHQAIEAGEPFDAVILDLTVPGAMGGEECVRHLRQLDPHVKAVVSSGYADEPIMAEHAAHGFAAVVTKPYGIEELSAALEGLIRTRRPQ